MEPAKLDHTVHSLPGCEPEIGRMLWQMEETKRRTLRATEKVPPEALDALPEGAANTIGTLLYHIAEAEASWLYEDILEQPLPPEVAALFPFGHHDEQGRLAGVRGLSLDSYRQRLEVVRGKLMEAYKVMTLEEFRNVHTQSGPTWNYDVSAEWVLHHLMQHEAEHRGHIEMIRDAYK